MIRDRKMYVVPTPFALTEGTTGQTTLILPREVPPDPRLRQVGELVRVESGQCIVGYAFDFHENVLRPQLATNPTAGIRHFFTAYRPRTTRGSEVRMRSINEGSSHGGQS